MTGGERGALARLGARHVPWLVALAALVAFLPSVVDGFVFDDKPLIENNAYAHDLRYLGRCFTTDLWATPDRTVAAASVKFYRPLVCASYVLGWNLGGGSAFSFHLTNVLLHAAASGLVARLLLRWTASVPAALLAGLVFAVHPSRSENVVWISGRTDILMGAFFFAAHEAARAAAGRTRATGLWAAAFGAFVLALLSKEFAVAWPLFLGVELFLVPRADAAVRGRLLRALIAASALSGLYLGARALWMPIRPPEIEGMSLPLGLHAGYVLLSFGYYVERVFFPWPQTFHFRPVAIVGGVPELFVPSVVVGGLALAALAAWLVVSWRRDRARAGIVAVGVAVLLPIINVSYTGFPGTTADRFLYLPLLPFAAAAARQGAPALGRWVTRSRLSSILVFSCTTLLGAVNWVRVLDYISEETVWRHELELNPENPQALAGLSQGLAAEGATEEAFLVLQRALLPGALRYGLLAKPTRYYLGLLELQGPRLADGYVSALEPLLAELVTLTEGGVPRAVRRSGDLELRAPTFDEHFRVHVANDRAALAVAGALVASRLGHDELVRALARRIPDGAAMDVSSRYNLSLAFARAGDGAAARRELALAEQAATPELRASLSAYAGALDRVASMRAEADRAPPENAAVLRATAFLELGAYLRAARALREVSQRNPQGPAVPLYVRALSAARLDDEAERTARAAAGPGARELLDAARAGLTERTRHAQAPPPGEVW